MYNIVFTYLTRRWMLALIVPILLAPGTLAGQNDKTVPADIALLEKKLESANRPEKLDILAEMAEKARAHSRIMELEINKRGLDLARELKGIKKESRFLLDLADNYSDIGKFKQTSRLLKKALALANKTGDKKIKGIALRHTGMLRMITGPYWEAKKYLQDALTLLKEYGEKHSIALTQSFLAEYYRRGGLVEYALELHLDALNMAEESGDRYTVAKITNLIAVLYAEMDTMEVSLKYFNSSLDIYRKLGYIDNIASLLNNTGRAHAMAGQLEKAMEYNRQALALYEKTGNQDGLASAYMSIGGVYKVQFKNKEALPYVKKAVKIYEQSGNLSGLGLGYFNLGELYTGLQEYDQAEDFLDKALACIDKSGRTRSRPMVIHAFARLFEFKGQYKNALTFYKNYLNDELTHKSEKTTRQMADAQARYDSLKKEQRIQLLEKERKIDQLELSRQKVTRNAFIVGFILVSIILALLFKKFLYFFTFWKKQKYISRFRLTDQIGAGGMGTVFKAHSIRDKTETVAIKVLKPEMFKDESNRKRFKQEGAIVDQLEHPNIVKIYERGEYRDKLYIAMEHLDGNTLDEVLAKHQPGLERSLNIMRQVADAIAFIHGKSIIHRDLKPSNIMLIEKSGQKDFVKLLDFGLAQTKFQTRITRTGVLMGTLNYMSPEQLTNSQFSMASDIFSLGATFYELVTGKVAFSGNYANEVMKQILDTVPVEPCRFQPEVPEELNNLVMKMIEKDKNKRPSIGEVLEILDMISSP